MKSILFVSSEIAPFAATGGLGDVLGSFPKAIKALDDDLDVRAVMPLYSQISAEWRSKMTFIKWITVKVAWRQEYCGIFSLENDGVTYYFIDNERYFSRSRIYGEFDDGERFAFFSFSALDLMAAVGFYPDVLHANDWQSAAAVIALNSAHSQDKKYRNIKSVYTIHNMDYQGVFDMGTYDDVFGFRWDIRGIVEFDGKVNLTKGAIELADVVTTVSPKYAEEIQSEPTAHGLGEILRLCSSKIYGVINGIDYKEYDPESDGDIPSVFCAENLLGKAVCKETLQRRLGLREDPNVPVVAMVTRLAEHKGIDLVTRVADEIVSGKVQFVLLGVGEKRYEDFFVSFAHRHIGEVSVSISFDRALSKLIYAGADMFLMPSKSEACGLAQMIASRYGTVPIVHEVGGLYDTVKPYGAGGNGFTFAAYNAHDMLYVIREACALFADKDKWTELVKKIMKIDFSWNASAIKYKELYEAL